MAVAKLKITNVDTNEEFTAWFNPKDYTIQRQNEWKFSDTRLPTAQFLKSKSSSMQLALLFDAASYGQPDVRGIADGLLRLMEPTVKGSDPAKTRPPQVKLQWGQHYWFNAVITNMSVQYVLFTDDGTPTRANVTLTVQQIDKIQYKNKSGPAASKQPQNPTTRGFEGLRSHLVRDGDSLQGLAYRYLGDPTRWRRIAEANGIDDPMRLRRGTSLSIPTETT